MNQMQLTLAQIITSLWTIVSVATFIVINTYRVTSYKAKVDEAIASIDKHIKDEEKVWITIKQLESKINQNEIKFAEMQVDIQWIKAGVARLIDDKSK